MNIAAKKTNNQNAKKIRLKNAVLNQIVNKKKNKQNKAKQTNIFLFKSQQKLVFLLLFCFKILILFGLYIIIGDCRK